MTRQSVRMRWGSLSSSGASSESISLQAPNTPGSYYYGACVESLSGESNTQNNCSSGVRVTVASSNTFEQTIAQIKNLENQLEQNRNRIEQEITQQRENHSLNAPKDQFESDAEYNVRKGQLYGILAESRQRLLVRYGIKNTQTQIAQLYRKTFPTNDVTVTLGTYNANEEYFPVTFEATLNGKDWHGGGTLYINRNDARNLHDNWSKVIKTGYLSIDPGYRQALAWVKLEYTPIWSKGIWWRFAEVYHLGDNNLSIAFSPDGKYIATGDKDNKATLWDISNGLGIWQKPLGTDVFAVTFSPDGKYLAADGYDYTTKHVALLAVSSGRIVQREGIQGSRGDYIDHVHSIEFSPDGRYLAIAVHHRWVWLWELGRKDSNRRKGWGIQGASVTHHATFSPDGRYLATGDDDGNANLWEVSTWWTDDVNIQYMDSGASGSQVQAVAFSPDGRYLAIDGYDGSRSSIIIWKVSSGTKVHQIDVDTYEIYSIAFSPDGKYLAVGDHDGIITLYQISSTEEINFRTKTVVERKIQTSDRVIDLAWSPGGSLISDGKKVYRVIPRPDIQGD